MYGIAIEVCISICKDSIANGALVEEGFYTEITDTGLTDISTATTLDVEPARICQCNADKDNDNHVTCC